MIADGAATHGDHAPGRRDDRAAPFDDGLAAVTPLAVLARLVGDRPPTAADLYFRGSPYGVGYFVASWRWAGR